MLYMGMSLENSASVTLNKSCKKNLLKITLKIKREVENTSDFSSGVKIKQ